MLILKDNKVIVAVLKAVMKATEECERNSWGSSVDIKLRAYLPDLAEGQSAQKKMTNLTEWPTIRENRLLRFVSTVSHKEGSVFTPDRFIGCATEVPGEYELELSRIHRLDVERSKRCLKVYFDHNGTHHKIYINLGPWLFATACARMTMAVAKIVGVSNARTGYLFNAAKKWHKFCKENKL